MDALIVDMFEARNPSNPAVVSEIDGEVTMGKVKRGNREFIFFHGAERFIKHSESSPRP